MSEIVIDLGDDGQILIDAVDEGSVTTVDDGTEKVGFGDTARKANRAVKRVTSTLLKLPLTGLAKLFLASAPVSAPDDPYELEQFSVEFNLGIKGESGVQAGAIAKVMQEGAFKCTYTWKRKAMTIIPVDKQSNS
jgi:Trypsin-co-occurring domain 1